MLAFRFRSVMSQAARALACSFLLIRVGVLVIAMGLFSSFSLLLSTEVFLEEAFVAVEDTEEERLDRGLWGFSSVDFGMSHRARIS